jgi:hypothetical protein
LTETKLKEIEQSFIRDPEIGLKRRASQLSISQSSCYTAAKILKMYPYRIQVVQELKESDPDKRKEYCEWFLDFIKEEGVLDLTFFSDEAWFHLSGYINSQNSRICGTTNPHRFIESSLHPQKIGVWCAISRKRIIGPIFFEKTINSEEYVSILQKFVPELTEEEIRHGYLQQDGATAHTAKETSPHLISYFANRLISKSNRFLPTEVEWPPRSPDLTSPDFFCGDI